MKKKLLLKILKSAFGIFCVMLGMFSIYAYFKLRASDRNLSFNGLINFCNVLVYYLPACLYAYLGNKYLKSVKRISTESFLDKFKMVIYTCLFFIAGIVITFVPFKFVSQLLQAMFCFIFGFREWTINDFSDPFFYIFACVMSSSVSIVIYQAVVEKHIVSNSTNEKK